jgi:hypothetical protein
LLIVHNGTTVLQWITRAQWGGDIDL